MRKSKKDPEDVEAEREALKQIVISAVKDRTGEDGVKEYLFAKPERKWRSDIAWPEVKVALEINGGVYSYGRHNRASGYLKDLEKGNGYAKRGWLLFQTPWSWLESDETRESLLNDIVLAITDRKEAEFGKGKEHSEHLKF